MTTVCGTLTMSAMFVVMNSILIVVNAILIVMNVTMNSSLTCSRLKQKERLLVPGFRQRATLILPSAARHRVGGGKFFLLLS